MSTSNVMQIDGDRLWASLMSMAEIGATEKGGSRRLALTDEDRQGRDLFIEWCRDAGGGISIDQMGNIFARRPGRNPDAAPVVAGSHLDTQPTGGRFDGVYGVLTWLEVVRTLNDWVWRPNIRLRWFAGPTRKEVGLHHRWWRQGCLPGFMNLILRCPGQMLMARL